MPSHLFSIKQAKEFLTALFPKGLGKCWIEFRFLHALGKALVQRYVPSLDAVPWQQVAQQNAKGWSVTFGPCLRWQQGGTKKDVGAISALWADLDFKRFKDGEQGAKEAITLLPPQLQPSATVHSGHGFHLWWFLEEPVPVTADNQGQLEAILRGIQKAVGSDPVHDLARVMRLPGSINVKDPTAPKPCKLIALDPDRRFRLEDFANLTPPVPSTQMTAESIQFSATLPKVTQSSLHVSQYMKDLIKCGWQKGDKYPSRSEADQAVITALRNAGHSPDVIKAVFVNAKWKIGERYREILQKDGPVAADGYLQVSIGKADQFLAAVQETTGPNILFVSNPSPPDLNKVEAVVKPAFPELWPVLLAVMSTTAAMLLDDVVNPPALILEGASSCGKTTVIDMVDGTPYLAYRTDKFTPKSFVTHAANVSEKDLADIDLLPRIRFRCMLTAELAPLFRGGEDELRSNFSMLTTVMDGRGLKTDSGTHGRRGYDGDYLFSWIGATTPLPTPTWNVMQQLGARLLFFWVNTPAPEIDAIVNNLVGPQAYKTKLAACRQVVNEYLLALFQQHARTGQECPFGITWDREKDPKDIVQRIAQLADVAAKARAPVSVWHDSEKDVQLEPPNIEQPYRLATMLYNVARGHALLYGRTQLSTDDLSVVARVALDSMPIERRRLFRMLIAAGPNSELRAAQVEAALACSRPTALKLMKTLEHLGIASMEMDTIDLQPGEHAAHLVSLKLEFSWLATPQVQAALGDLPPAPTDEAKGKVKKQFPWQK